MSFLNLTPKKLIVGAAIPMAVLASGGMVWQSSYSAFSATTVSPTSNWTAGTVALSDDDNNTALFTATNLKPGATGTKCIAVTSTGSLASTVKLYGTAYDHHQRPGRQHQPEGRAGHRRHDRHLHRLHRRHDALRRRDERPSAPPRPASPTASAPGPRPAPRPRPRPTGSPTPSRRAPPTPRRAAPPPSASPGSPRTADRSFPRDPTRERFIPQPRHHVPAQRTAPDQAAAPRSGAGGRRSGLASGAAGHRRPRLARAGRLARDLVAAAARWPAGPRDVIMSGSMEPRIHVGDVVVTRDVPGATLTKGQVITVKDPDHPAKTRTHRVLRRAADGTIVTKGDANPQADSSHISNENVLGVGVVRVPWVGRPAYWMAEQNWLALGATSLFLGWCLITVLPGSRKPEDTDGDDAVPSLRRDPPLHAFAPRRRHRRRCRDGRRSCHGPRRGRVQADCREPRPALSAAAHFVGDIHRRCSATRRSSTGAWARPAVRRSTTPPPRTRARNPARGDLRVRPDRGADHEPDPEQRARLTIAALRQSAGVTLQRHAFSRRDVVQDHPDHRRPLLGCRWSRPARTRTARSTWARRQGATSASARHDARPQPTPPQRRVLAPRRLHLHHWHATAEALRRRRSPGLDHRDGAELRRATGAPVPSTSAGGPETRPTSSSRATSTRSPSTPTCSPRPRSPRTTPTPPADRGLQHLDREQRGVGGEVALRVVGADLEGVAAPRGQAGDGVRRRGRGADAGRAAVDLVARHGDVVGGG